MIYSHWYPIFQVNVSFTWSIHVYRISLKRGMGNRKLKQENWKWGIKNDKLLIVNCTPELKIFCSRGKDWCIRSMNYWSFEKNVKTYFVFTTVRGSKDEMLLMRVDVSKYKLRRFFFYFYQRCCLRSLKNEREYIKVSGFQVVLKRVIC